jgi:hypothetical protein
MSALLLVAVLLCARPASGQTYTAGADIFFYGDNTEFANSFRSGETTLGASGTVFLDIALNETVTLRGGLFGLGRFGSHEFLEHAEPAIALRLSRGSSRFNFGSLDTISTRHDVAGPDLETPHRLLPPLQEETLSFTRGQEMGLQWLVASPRLDHDAWINWQRLNTADHRERFDAGYRVAVGLPAALSLHGQWHIVHDGGQKFQSGPVGESQAGAVGLQWSPTAGPTLISVDGYAVATKDEPDRANQSGSESGLGLFLRGAVQRDRWRAHAIVWRGRDTIKEEGDPNYLSRHSNGTLFRNTRDYAELGVTRQFEPAAGVHMFAAFRVHRVESDYAYSYRIVGRVRLRHKF